MRLPEDFSSGELVAFVLLVIATAAISIITVLGVFTRCSKKKKIKIDADAAKKFKLQQAEFEKNNTAGIVRNMEAPDTVRNYEGRFNAESIQFSNFFDFRGADLEKSKAIQVEIAKRPTSVISTNINTLPKTGFAEDDQQNVNRRRTTISSAASLSSSSSGSIYSGYTSGSGSVSYYTDTESDVEGGQTGVVIKNPAKEPKVKEKKKRRRHKKNKNKEGETVAATGDKVDKTDKDKKKRKHRKKHKRANKEKGEQDEKKNTTDKVDKPVIKKKDGTEGKGKTGKREQKLSYESINEEI